MFHPSLVSTHQQVNGYRNWRAFFGPPCPPPWKTNRAKKVARSWNNKRHLQKSHRHYRHCTMASIITDLWFVHSTEYTQWVFPWLRQPRRALVFFDLFAPSMIPCLFCMAMQLSGINFCRCFLRLSRNADPELSCLGSNAWDTFLHRTSELTFPNDINDRIELQLAPGLSCLFIPAFSAFGAFGAFLLTSLLSLKRRHSFTMFCKIGSQRTSCNLQKDWKFPYVSMSSSVSASSASARFLSWRFSQMSWHTLHACSMIHACHTPQLFSFFLLGELCNALSSAPVKQLKCVIACRQQKLAVHS